jgi:hypothetical protein
MLKRDGNGKKSLDYVRLMNFGAKMVILTVALLGLYITISRDIKSDRAEIVAEIKNNQAEIAVAINTKIDKEIGDLEKKIDIIDAMLRVNIAEDDQVHSQHEVRIKRNEADIQRLESKAP